MSSTYMPTSNWTDRTIKGRGSTTSPSRSHKPETFRGDRSAAATNKTASAEGKTPRSDGLMDQIQAARETQIFSDGDVDVMDLPMDPHPAQAASSAVMDQPLDDALPLENPDEAGVGATSVTAPIASPEPRQRTSGNLRNTLLMAAPVAIVAVAAVGFLMLNQGEGAPTPAAAPLPETAPQVADEALVGMPVTDATVVPEAASLTAPAAAAVITQASPVRPEPRVNEAPRASAQAEEAAQQSTAQAAVATTVRAEPVQESIVIEPTEPVALEPIAAETQTAPVVIDTISPSTESPALDPVTSSTPPPQ